jgi:hypothetical protein
MWTVSHRIRWTPIITFARRRLRLLDWFEEYTSPVAFYENDEHVGISLVDRGLRLMISRTHATLSSSTAGLSIDQMEPALRGVFEVLEPKGGVLATTNSVWTCDIEDGEYNEERAALAAAMTGVRGRESGFRAIDTSALVDFESLEHLAQVEYGVVEATELQERLTDPDLGRMGSGSARLPYTGLLPEVVPPVSLLVEVALRRRVGGTVSSAGDVLQVAATEAKTASRIVSILAEGHEEGRGKREHSEAG